MNDKQSNEDRTSAQELLAALLGLGSDSVHAASEHTKPAIETGRLWLRRVILILVLWPVLLILVSLVSPEESVNTLVSSIAIGIPIVAFLALVLKWPLISVSIAAVSIKLTIVRRILGGLLFVVFLELAAGIYFSIVPVRNAPELFSLRVLVITAMGVLALSVALLDKKEWRPARTAMWILSVILILVTVVSFLGVERTKELLIDTKEFVEEQSDSATEQVASVQVCPGEPQNYRFAEGAVQLVVSPQPDCWSGSVIIPPLHTWRFDTESPFEVLTWDGRVLPAGPNHADEWWGDISGGDYNNIANGIYRIRGSSLVTITIEEIIG